MMIIIDVIYFTIIIVYLNVLDLGCKFYSYIINEKPSDQFLGLIVMSH
jgi:hypothetical protein